MALVIPPPPTPPDWFPKSVLPEGGSPATDRRYEAWRDDLLASWSERLVTRFFHSLDMLDLMPAWHFDEELCERLGGNDPMLPPFNYHHRLRWLGIELDRRPKGTEKVALAILAEGAHIEAEQP